MSNVPTPSMADPPAEYSQDFFRRHIGVLRDYFGRLKNASSLTIEGYANLPVRSGAPTAPPHGAAPGSVLVVFDKTTSTLWVYNGGWKSVTLT